MLPRRGVAEVVAVEEQLVAHATGGERAAVRFLEFFASAIRNPHTRRAYARSVANTIQEAIGSAVLPCIWLPAGASANGLL